MKKAVASIIVAGLITGCIGLAACTPSSNESSETSTDTSTCGQHENLVPGCESCHEGTDQSLYTAPSKEACLKCHDSYEALAEKTAGMLDSYLYNPHKTHYGELECTQCHSNHGTSELMCTQCHDGYILPDGWTAKPME